MAELDGALSLSFFISLSLSLSLSSSSSSTTSTSSFYHFPPSLTRSTCTSNTRGSLSWLASCLLDANVGGCGPRGPLLAFEMYPAEGGTNARRLEPGSAPARAESSPGTRSPVPCCW